MVVGGTPDHPTAIPVAGVPNAPQLDATQRAKAIQQYNYAKQLQDTADHLNLLFQRGPGKTKGLRGIGDYFSTPDNVNFDTAANQSRGIIGQALNFTGGQLNTPQEAAKAVGPFLPQSSDFDSTIIQKIQALQDMAKNGRENAIQTLGGVPDANGNIHPVDNGITASNQLPNITLPGSDHATFATGKTRDVIDPVLKATGQRVGRMLSSGVDDAKIINFLRRSGVDPANTDIQDILQFRAGKPLPDGTTFKQWQRQNPGQAYPIGPKFYTKQVPMSGVRSLVNQAASNDVGGTALAAGAGATNAIMGDRLASAVGALTGEPGTAETGMQLLSSNHPFADLAGNVAGQAALEAMAGGVPGVGKLMATPWGRRAVDAAYGYYYGSGDSAGEDPTIGGLEGAGTNLIGGVIGRNLARATGGVIKGIQNPDLNYLHAANIPLTPGRIARGAGDFNPLHPATAGDEVGKGIAGIEDRLAGLPGLDAVIGTARQRGDQAFNQATFREIAPGVTGTGAEGLTSAKAAEQAAYAKIAPVRLAVDKPFTDSLDAAEQTANGLTHHAGDVKTVIADVRQQIANGEMTGKGYQTALQAIRGTRATLNDDVGGKAAAALTDLENQVTELGNRQGGQVAQDLAAANAIHANRQTVKTALKSGTAQGAGEMFSPKGLNQASIANTTKFGGLDKALSSDRPFYNLSSAGMKVMPNLTPDSGTAGRLLLYPLIAGAGGGALGAAAGSDRTEGAERGGEIGTGLALATLALGAGPYSRMGQKIIQKALLSPRSDRTIKIGKFIINKADLMGLIGSGIGRQEVFQPPLAQ
jgi:hypothetical protein